MSSKPSIPVGEGRSGGGNSCIKRSVRRNSGRASLNTTGRIPARVGGNFWSGMASASFAARSDPIGARVREPAMGRADGAGVLPNNLPYHGGDRPRQRRHRARVARLPPQSGGQLPRDDCTVANAAPAILVAVARATPSPGTRSIAPPGKPRVPRRQRGLRIFIARALTKSSEARAGVMRECRSRR